MARILRPTLAALAVTAVGLAAAPAALAQAQPRPAPAQAQAQPPAPPPAQAQAPARPAAPAAAAPATEAARPAQPLPQITFEEIMGMDARQGRWSPVAMGVGAIGGVIGYNILAPTLFPVSNAAGGPVAGTILADSAIAASRVYAISSAVAGAFIGQWIYDQFSER